MRISFRLKPAPLMTKMSLKILQSSIVGKSDLKLKNNQQLLNFNSFPCSSLNRLQLYKESVSSPSQLGLFTASPVLIRVKSSPGVTMMKVSSEMEVRTPSRGRGWLRLSKARRSTAWRADQLTHSRGRQTNRWLPASFQLT
jgi:hypothetical protein